MRIALGVEYNGSGFKGWERQPGERTVQDCLERALSKVADSEVVVAAAGRTDAGVHAIGQVVHFDTAAPRALYNWMLGANSWLPKDVAVHWAAPVDESFHARHSAIARRYRYLILNRRARPAALTGSVSWCHRPLDAGCMHEAAQALLGENDFSSYRAAACQSHTPMRRLDYISVMRQQDTVVIEVVANAFLHHMVRNIAGVLMAIGSGERPVSWAAEVLAARDRRQGGFTATADGLYLVEVMYPEAVLLPRPPSRLGIML